jgi:non-specific serine/threonine protein kinase
VRPALDEPDLGCAVQRLTPYGDATVRLPRELPVPDAFRAIVNRCLDPYPHQRFRHARTMARWNHGCLRNIRRPAESCRRNF